VYLSTFKSIVDLYLAVKFDIDLLKLNAVVLLLMPWS